MAKTRLNQTHRSEIKKIIKDYVQRIFNNDERFKKLLEDEKEIKTILQEKYNYFTNTTQEVINYLQSCNSYGQNDVINKNYSYYQCYLHINCLQAYCCKFNYNDIQDKCLEFLSRGDCDYSDCIYSGNLMRIWLENSEIWNKYDTQMVELNKEYSEMQTKMYMIVDNCKYLEDVKEYLPTEEVINYINQTLYNCSTFISCITSEDLSIVKDFIHNNKKDS